MARILYGVCGEGLGHASRSRILIHHLKKNHDIQIIAGGKAYTLLSGEFEGVTEIESARFIYEHDQVDLLRTIGRNMVRTLIGTLPSFRKIRRLIKTFHPDIVITDADPIGHYAARCTRGLKRISIDNPQALHYRSYTVEPRERFPWFTLYSVTKLGMYGADKYLIYDFFDDPSSNNKVVFLKPLIQEGILKQIPRYGSHVFVYQTIGAGEHLLNTLKQSDESFVIYGSNQDCVDENLVFKPFNEDEFYHDIAQAKAVITNGGFTVISEALYLKKPILSLPIRNQFEQILNGKFITQLGAGEYHMDIDIDKFVLFFTKLDAYKQQLQAYDPGDQQQTLHHIEHEIVSLITDLSKK